MQKKSSELKVFISNRDSSRCDECGEDLGRKAWIFLDKAKGALCLSCADLDHLGFLPRGDTALTRRAKKYSKLWAVVLKWSRARKQYERQGLLVEEEAFQEAEQECLSDSEIRARRRERDALRRAELDRQYVEQFARRIRERYPSCPEGSEKTITEHACLKYSERIGRSAAAKDFEEEALRLAVIAHIRHRYTNYDELLMEGYERWEARKMVEEKVLNVLWKWEGKK